MLASALFAFKITHHVSKSCSFLQGHQSNPIGSRQQEQEQQAHPNCLLCGCALDTAADDSGQLKAAELANASPHCHASHMHSNKAQQHQTQSTSLTHANMPWLANSRVRANMP
jgi:hypothetical protein